MSAGHSDLLVGENIRDVWSPEQQEQQAGLVLHALLPGILHELNNPMSYLIGNIESLQEYTAFLGEGARILLQHPAGSETYSLPGKHEMSGWLRSVEQWKQQEDVGHLLQDTEAIMRDMMAGIEVWSAILDGLRLYLRRPRLVRESVDIHGVLEKSLRLVQHLGQKKVEFRRKFSFQGVWQGDAVLLCRALVCIIKNALEAVSQQPRSWLEMRTSSSQGHLVITIVVTIQDNSFDVAGKEIEDSETSGDSGSTLSVGANRTLQMAEQIVLWHQGKFVVQHVLGQGSTVTLSFPGDVSGQ